MEVRISDAISKDQVNFLAGKSLNGTGNTTEVPSSKTNNEPEETDIKQTGNIVVNLQGTDTYSENGELTTGKVTESQEKGFDQYY